MTITTTNVPLKDLIPALCHQGVLQLDQLKNGNWREQIIDIKNNVITDILPVDDENDTQSDSTIGSDEISLSLSMLQERLSNSDAGEILEKLELSRSRDKDGLVLNDSFCYFDCIDILNALIVSDKLGRSVLMQYKCKIIQHWMSIVKRYRENNLHILESCSRLIDLDEEYRQMSNRVNVFKKHSLDLQHLRSEFSTTIQSNKPPTSAVQPFLSFQVENISRQIKYLKDEESKLYHMVDFTYPEKMSYLRDRLSNLIEEQMQGQYLKVSFDECNANEN